MKRVVGTVMFEYQYNTTPGKKPRRVPDFGKMKIRVPRLDTQRSLAQDEYAWTLRAEGLSLRDIAERLDCSHENVRNMIVRFNHLAFWATQNAIWRWL